MIRAGASRGPGFVEIANDAYVAGRRRRERWASRHTRPAAQSTHVPGSGMFANVNGEQDVGDLTSCPYHERTT